MTEAEMKAELVRLKNEMEKQASEKLAQVAKLQADLELQREENAKLHAQQAARITVKPGRDADHNDALTGTVSVYGVRRFPASFYPEEWEKIFSAKEQILAVCKRDDVKAAAATSKANRKAGN